MSRAGRPTFRRDVAPGVHLLAHAHVNCYLLQEGTSLTLVDTGLPRTHRYLVAAIEVLGRRLGDVEAIVLTHAHFDHVGSARRLQEETGRRVLVHPLDDRLARHPYRYAHERARSLYPLLHPRAVPVLAAMAGAGALAVRGVDRLDHYDGTAGALDVPGRPVVVETPGHTNGHCALHLPGSDAVITGDALVTLDPYTGATGPRIVAGAATADSRLALDSLTALEATDATVVLPGHGAPSRDGIRRAAAAARAAGPS